MTEPSKDGEKEIEVQVDPESIKAAVRESVDDALKAQAAETRRVAAATQAASQPQPGADPVRDVVMGAVGKDLAQANFMAAAAMDAATFYAAHPELGRAEWKDTRLAVEQKFQEAIAGGLALPREDILAWWIGKNHEKYGALTQAERQAEEARVAGVAVAGPGGSRTITITKDPWEMNPEELDTALKGQEF